MLKARHHNEKSMKRNGPYKQADDFLTNSATGKVTGSTLTNDPWRGLQELGRGENLLKTFESDPPTRTHGKRPIAYREQQ